MTVQSAKIARIKALLSRRPLLAGISAAFLAMLFAGGYLKQREGEILNIAEPVAVVVAAKDIQQGEVVDEGNLTLTKAPRRFVQPGFISGMGEAAGRVAVTAIQRGTQITLAVARRPSPAGGLSAVIPAGRRAVAVAIDDATGVAGLIRPNDKVDVLATLDVGSEEDKRRITMTVVSDAPVLAVGREFAGALPSEPKKKNRSGIFSPGQHELVTLKQMTATLAVTPQEAQIIAFVRESGAVGLALRPFGEEVGETDEGPTDIESVAGVHGGIVPMKRSFREYRGK